MTNLTKIKEISIVDFARDIGFTPRKIGRYYTLKEHDSVRIDPTKNLWRQNSTGAGGSVIDFAVTFLHLSVGDSIKLLKEKEGIKEVPAFLEKKQEKKSAFLLPKEGEHAKNIFAYLIKRRGIPKEIVVEMIKRNKLYQDEKRNCVFVSHDEKGNAVFATMRGTNTYQKFIGDVKGSDYQYCFFVDNKAERLVITESAIDALSKMALLDAEGKSHRAYNYLSLSGVSKASLAIKSHLGKMDYKEITLALDNDAAGKKATKEIQGILKEEGYQGKVIVNTPKLKDINEDLLNYQKRKVQEMEI